MTHDTIAAIREALCEVDAQLGRYMDGGYISQKVWLKLHTKMGVVNRKVYEAEKAERGNSRE